MCDSLILSKKTGKPITVSPEPHKFIYYKEHEKHVLLENFYLEGVIDYAAIHQIENQHGVRKGYMLIVGEEQ